MRVRAEKVLPSGSTYYNIEVVGQGDSVASSLFGNVQHRQRQI